MISIALTNYNRFEMLLESFAQVKDDERISEIIIVDDKSTDGCYEKLCDALKDEPKIRLLQNPVNLGMGRAKYEAVKAASNEWVILFDSDNIITTAYIDALFAVDKVFSDHQIICLPDFAAPGFCYEKFAGTTLHKGNIKDIVQDSMGNCMMNTCNYVCHRDYYSHIFQYNSEHIASDTVWHAYNHLLSGGKFYVVPGMKYFHRQHAGSSFLQEVDYNMKKAKEVKDLILQF